MIAALRLVGQYALTVATHSMSLSRVWLSGCQPLARACACPPAKTYALHAPYLGNRLCLVRQSRTAPFLRDQRPSGTQCCAFHHGTQTVQITVNVVGLSYQSSNRVSASASSLVSWNLQLRLPRQQQFARNTLHKACLSMCVGGTGQGEESTTPCHCVQ